MLVYQLTNHQVYTYANFITLCQDSISYNVMFCLINAVGKVPDNFTEETGPMDVFFCTDYRTPVTGIS